MRVLQCTACLVAVVLLVAAASVLPASAQDSPKTPPTMADGTTSAQQPAPQNKSDEVAPQEKVLSKSSIFFPDLATNRSPLTTGGKFRLFAANSIAPATIVGSAFGAGISQASDSHEAYGQGAEGYGKRFGALMATGTASKFFGGFLIASATHTDPRYFVSGEGRFKQRLGHAVSRVFVAPKDSGGYGFNWGGVFGPLCAETLANTYLPVKDQTGARTMSRYGTDMATTAGLNLLKEFWPDIFKRLGLKK